MKRVLIVLDERTFKAISKVKKYNKHTWEQALLCYADAYKKED